MVWPVLVPEPIRQVCECFCASLTVKSIELTPVLTCLSPAATLRTTGHWRMLNSICHLSITLLHWVPFCPFLAHPLHQSPWLATHSALSELIHCGISSIAVHGGVISSSAMIPSLVFKLRYSIMCTGSEQVLHQYQLHGRPHLPSFCPPLALASFYIFSWATVLNAYIFISSYLSSPCLTHGTAVINPFFGSSSCSSNLLLFSRICIHLPASYPL